MTTQGAVVWLLAERFQVLEHAAEAAGACLLMLERLLFRLDTLSRGPCLLRLEGRWVVRSLQEAVDVQVQAALLLDGVGEVCHALAVGISVAVYLELRSLCMILRCKCLDLIEIGRNQTIESVVSIESVVCNLTVI